MTAPLQGPCAAVHTLRYRRWRGRRCSVKGPVGGFSNALGGARSAPPDQSRQESLRMAPRTPTPGLCLKGGGGRLRGSQGQLQRRLQVTHKAVGGSYWRLEGRLQVVGRQAKA